jgi:dolichyl-phosphate-mannose-protein mannosyltransferase
VIAIFAYFAPLTYSVPITAEQFEMRDWFSIWRMEVIR